VTRVLIIDDHPVVLRGCRQLFEGAGIDDIMQAQTTAEGFKLYRQSKPDVIIVDLEMSAQSLDGVSFLRRLRQRDQQTPVLVFSMHNDPSIVAEALEAGANGYLLKDAAPRELLNAFESVSEGKRYLGHDLAVDVVVDALRSRAELTPRELETLALVAQGKPHGAIAAELDVSYKTVANICTQLKNKLGARNRPELMRLAMEYLPASAQAGAPRADQKRLKDPLGES
jgi:DNA-binding NarL/FixJ family response regulator